MLWVGWGFVEKSLSSFRNPLQYRTPVACCKNHRLIVPRVLRWGGWFRWFLISYGRCPKDGDCIRVSSCDEYGNCEGPNGRQCAPNRRAGTSKRGVPRARSCWGVTCSESHSAHATPHLEECGVEASLKHGTCEHPPTHGGPTDVIVRDNFHCACAVPRECVGN